jgi:hypothetical protein
MKNPAVKYGVYALLISIIWTIIEHFLGYNTTNHETGQYARLVGTIVFYILIVVAIFAARKHQNVSLSFGDGFKTGVGVSLIYGLGITAWYAIYGEVINTQYKPTLMAFERAKLEAAHTAPEVITVQMKQVDMNSGGSVLSYVFLFVFMTLIGVIIAAVTSAILRRRRRKKQFEN